MLPRSDIRHTHTHTRAHTHNPMYFDLCALCSFCLPVHTARILAHAFAGSLAPLVSQMGISFGATHNIGAAKMSCTTLIHVRRTQPVHEQARTQASASSQPETRRCRRSRSAARTTLRVRVGSRFRYVELSAITFAVIVATVCTTKSLEYAINIEPVWTDIVVDLVLSALNVLRAAH